MNRYRLGHLVVLLAVAVTTTLIHPPAVLNAQGRGRTTLGLGGGYSSYDLSGTGSTFVISARLDHRLLSAIVTEVAVTYFQYDPQLSSGQTDRLLFPELSLQAQLPLGPVYPYIGGGIGFAQVLSGPESRVLTLHAATGLRVRIGDRWGIRGELRPRAVDPWGAVTADFTLGVARAL